MLAWWVLCLLPGPLDWHAERRPEPDRGGRSPSGRAYLSEDQFVVNEKASFEYHYVVGPSGMGPGDSLRIEDPLFHGMTWAKWGRITFDPDACSPQTDAQSSSIGLMTARSSTGAAVTVSRNVDETAGLNDYAYTDIVLDADVLVEGEEIVVTYGDVSLGENCGFEMSDRAWHRVEIPAYESIGGSALAPLSTVPSFEVVAESVVKTLLVTAPSQVPAGMGADLRVAVLDGLGNPIEGWVGDVSVNDAYGGATTSLTADDHGVAMVHVNLDTAGEVARVTVAGSDGSVGTSNPILVYDPATPPEYNVYWGDLHVHHGHSYVDDSGAYVDENIVYARDVIGLDFSAESQKAEPIEIDSAVLWSERQENCVGESEDGRYIAMLGFEWMGDHIGGTNQGHHNFYFDTCDAPLGAHYDAVASPGGIGAFDSTQGPYAYAAQLLESGIQTVVIPHATLYTGRSFGGASVNNEVRTTAEVYSEWGFDMVPENRVGSIPDALAQGNRMGFIAASDNHDGWMGNPFSVKNVRSGLAAVRSPALTRAGIFDNLQHRNTYATTGERMLVDLGVDDGGAVRMGQEYVAAAPTFSWSAHGTQRITSVKLRTVAIGPGNLPETVQTWAPNTLDASGSVDYVWDGVDRAVWLDVVQLAEPLYGDADEAWSSPIWLTAECGRAGVQDPAGRCPSVDSDTNGDSPEDSDSGRVDSDSTAPVDDSDTAAPPPQGRCSGCASAGDSGVTGALLLAIALLSRRRS